MKSLKSLRSRFRLPHALTLLFLIIGLMGTLSLILSWSNVTTKDGTAILGAGILD
ncbi:MAG: hypothetical protein QJQ54_01540 [Mollicutes bacterium]|nr:MAG: hypothetical protein QJQ54_01540 [Mollicutes bacterium]